MRRREGGKQLVDELVPILNGRHGRTLRVVVTDDGFDAGAEVLGVARQVIRPTDLATDSLAIVFPGAHYTCDRPLLHFGSAVFRSGGWDVLKVNYPDLRAQAFEAQPDDVQMAQFRAFARSVAEGVTATGLYDRIALVGKSLGTVAVADIVMSRAFDNAVCGCVLVTPLASEPAVAQAVTSLPRTLVVLGDDDAGSPACCLLFGDIAGVEVQSFPGGHSLELDNDAVASVAVLGKYVAALTCWLDAGTR